MSNKSRPPLIGAIIPCFKSPAEIIRLAEELLQYVCIAVFVDDYCPYHTGQSLSAHFNYDERVVVLFHTSNGGVGKAFKTGADYLIKQNVDYVLKIDSDYQMEPKNIPLLFDSIRRANCQVAKSTRLTSMTDASSMPLHRLVGNLSLTFMARVSTGYWELSDPTNGFILMKTDTLQLIQYHRLADDYLFETDFLFRCAINNITINEVPMPAIYNNSHSSLNEVRIIAPMLHKHLQILTKRVLIQYYLRDFNIGSLELLLAALFSFSTFVVAIMTSLNTINTGIPAVPGNIGLFLALLILSCQFLISFIYYDTNQQVLFRLLRSLKKS